MTTSSAGPSKRNMTLAAATAGALLVLILGGVWLATRPDPAQQASSALPGAAITDMTFVDPPGWDKTEGVANMYHLQPASLADTDNAVQPFGSGDGAGNPPFAVGVRPWDDVQPWFLYRQSDGSFFDLRYSYTLPATITTCECSLIATMPYGKYVVRAVRQGNYTWGFVDAGDGHFRIYNKTSGLCLDGEGGRMASGSLIVVATCDPNSSSQLFDLFRLD